MRQIVLNFFAKICRPLMLLAICCCAAMVLTGCAAWHAQQRLWSFRPTPGRPADFVGLREGDVISKVQLPDLTDEVQLWWLPSGNPQAPTVLYLHGTFRNLYQNMPKIEAFRQAGFSVVAVEYRGWGESTPLTPSEASIYADAQLGWQELVRRQPNPAKRLIYGHSMGGAVAIELASARQAHTEYGALMVESSFSRWPDVAAVRGVLGTVLSWLAVDEFDSVQKIGRVNAPIFLLHGALDRTVDIKLGYRLRDAAPAGTRFIEIAQGSHSRLFSDAPELYQQILAEIFALLDRPLSRH
jgi:uncharacterized protein